MKKILFVVIGFALIAFTLSASVSGVFAAQGDVTGNVNFFRGEKSLSDDWYPADKHDVDAIQFDFKKEEWPASIAIELLVTGTEDTIGARTVETETQEFNVGIKKIFDQHPMIQPFIGLGVSYMRAKYGYDDVSVPNYPEHDTDENYGSGYWYGAGVYLKLGTIFKIGLEYKESKADIKLFDTEVEAGGKHSGVLIGFSW